MRRHKVVVLMCKRLAASSRLPSTRLSTSCSTANSLLACYALPVAWLFLLMNRTEMSFGEYQKEFFKWSIPMFFIFIVTAIVTGELPVG